MKMTIDIPDLLLAKAREVAQREGVTLDALIERGLRRVIADVRGAAPFRLKNVAFKGRGLHPDAGDGSWERLSDLVYEGRGGLTAGRPARESD